MIDADLRTIWCGNLSEKVTDTVLFELFLQAGPVERVSIPVEKTGRQRPYGFITYKYACSIPYALQLYRGTQLFNRELELKYRDEPNPAPRSRSARGQRSQATPSTSAEYSNMFQESFLDSGWAKYLQIGSLAPPLTMKPDGLAKSSLQGQWANRTHPYARAGRKRNNRSRSNKKNRK